MGAPLTIIRSWEENQFISDIMVSIDRILEHDSLVRTLALVETGLQRMVSCDVERYIVMAEIIDMAGS